MAPDSTDVAVAMDVEDDARRDWTSGAAGGR